MAILRRICKIHNSKMVILPSRMMRELGWYVGDYIAIDFIGNDTLTIRRVKNYKLTDDEIKSAGIESEIIYE